MSIRSSTLRVGSSNSGRFAMANRHLNIPPLADHIEALGYLCIFYAHLERRINDMIGQLTGFKGERLGSITNHIDLNKKLLVAKHLGFLSKPSQSWYDDLDLTLWLVENHIMPNRNRYIHDGLLSTDAQVYRRYQRTRIEPGRKGEPITLTTVEYVPLDAEQIWSVTLDAMNAAAGLDALRNDLKAGKPQSSLWQSFRDEWSARRKPPKAKKSKERPAPAKEARVK